MYLQPLLRNRSPKASELGEITQTTRPLRRSRSFKITDFGTNRNPVCDVLLVINSNLPPILHRFQVMADYWSNFRKKCGGAVKTNKTAFNPRINKSVNLFAQKCNRHWIRHQERMQPSLTDCPQNNDSESNNDNTLKIQLIEKCSVRTFISGLRQRSEIDVQTTNYTVFQKKHPLIIGYKLMNSCPISIIFDIKIPHIIWHRMTA